MQGFRMEALIQNGVKKALEKRVQSIHSFDKTASCQLPNNYPHGIADILRQIGSSFNLWLETPIAVFHSLDGSLNWILHLFTLRQNWVQTKEARTY
jgi:hypothetical protein